MSIDDAFYKKKLAQMSGGIGGPDPAAAALSLLGQQENEEDKAMVQSLKGFGSQPVAPLPGYPSELSAPAEVMPDLSSLLGVPEPTPESDAALMDSLTQKSPPVPDNIIDLGQVDVWRDGISGGEPVTELSPLEIWPNRFSGGVPVEDVPAPSGPQALPARDQDALRQLAEEQPPGARRAPWDTGKPPVVQLMSSPGASSAAPATTAPAPGQPQAEADATPPAPASGQEAAPAAPDAAGAAASEQPDGVPRDRSVQENLDEIRVRKDKEAATLAMTQPQSTGDAKRDYNMFDSRMRMLQELRSRHTDTRTRLAITALMEGLGRTALNFFRVQAGQSDVHGGQLPSLRLMEQTDREYRQAESAFINEWAEAERAAETERTRQQTAERQARGLELSERRTVATEQRAATEAERRATELALSDPSSRESADARERLTAMRERANRFGLGALDTDIGESSANDMRSEINMLAQNWNQFSTSREGRRAIRRDEERRARERARQERGGSRRGGGGGGSRATRSALPSEIPEAAEVEDGVTENPRASIRTMQNNLALVEPGEWRTRQEATVSRLIDDARSLEWDLPRRSADRIQQQNRIQNWFREQRSVQADITRHLRAQRTRVARMMDNNRRYGDRLMSSEGTNFSTPKRMQLYFRIDRFLSRYTHIETGEDGRRRRVFTRADGLGGTNVLPLGSRPSGTLSEASQQWADLVTEIQQLYGRSISGTQVSDGERASFARLFGQDAGGAQELGLRRIIDMQRQLLDSERGHAANYPPEVVAGWWARHGANSRYARFWDEIRRGPGGLGPAYDEWTAIWRSDRNAGTPVAPAPVAQRE